MLAPPSNPTPQTLAAYQEGFQSLKLVWSVAKGEFDDATNPRQPFGFQLPALPPNGKGGLLVFARGGSIPENPAVPALWPQVALVKLASDPERKTDFQSLVVQGTPEETRVTGKPPGPLVVIQGITLLDDSLARTIAGPVPAAPVTAALRDHLTALVRPAAVCFDPKRVDLGGVLVTPHLTGRSADGSESGERPLFDAKVIAQQPERPRGPSRLSPDGTLCDLARLPDGPGVDGAERERRLLRPGGRGPRRRSRRELLRQAADGPALARLPRRRRDHRPEPGGHRLRESARSSRCRGSARRPSPDYSQAFGCGRQSAGISGACSASRPRRASARLRGLASAPRRIYRHLDALAAKLVNNPG